MPSGIYTVDRENGKALAAWGSGELKAFFKMTDDLDALVDDVQNECTSTCIADVIDEYVATSEFRTRCREALLSVGFFENGSQGNLAYLLKDGVLLLPDFIRIDKAPGANSQYRYGTALKICRYEYHNDPSEMNEWADKFHTPKPHRLRVKVLWGEKEVKWVLDMIENEELRAHFGKLEYRGLGSVSALDDYELGVYNLSHPRQEIIDHFNLWFDNDPETVHSYMRHHKLTRNAIKAKKAFPCPYQTIDRDSLPSQEDTVVGLGQKGVETALFASLWWDENYNEICYERLGKDCWDEHNCHLSITKMLLPIMEQIGLVENRFDSPYGLLYRVLESSAGDCFTFIPDFIRVNDRHPVAIALVDDKEWDDNKRTEMYRIHYSCVRALAGRVSVSFVYLSKLNVFMSTLPDCHKASDVPGIVGTIQFARKFDPIAKMALATYEPAFVENAGTLCRALEYAHVKNHVTYEADMQFLRNFYEQHQNEFIGTLLTGGMSVLNEQLNMDPYVLSNFAHYLLEDIGDQHSFVWKRAFHYVDDYSRIPEECKTAWKSIGFTRVYSIEALPASVRMTYEQNTVRRRCIRDNMVPFGYFENSVDTPYGLLYWQNGDDIVIPDFLRFTHRKRQAIVLFDFETPLDRFNRLEGFLDANAIFDINIVWTGREFEIFRRELENGTWQDKKNPSYYRGYENPLWSLANDNDVVALQKEDLSAFQIAMLTGNNVRLVSELMRLLPLEAPREGFCFPQYPVNVTGLLTSKSELKVAPVLEKLDIHRNDGSVNLEYKEVVFDVFGIREMHPDYVSVDRKVVVEFDGVYFHLDPLEVEFRKMYYDYIGVQCSVIWDLELKEFLANPPRSVDELLDRYPCTWRNPNETGSPSARYNVFADKLVALSDYIAAHPKQQP